MKISFFVILMSIWNPIINAKTRIIENKLYLENYTLTITHSSEIQDSSQLIIKSNKSIYIFNSGPNKAYGQILYEKAKKKSNKKIKLILTSPKPENVFGANFFLKKNINVYSSYTLAKLIPIRCIKCLERTKKNHPQFIGKTKLIKEVSNLTHTEINELNKLGIKLKFFGKNEVIIPIFEEIKIAFTSGILDKNYIPNLENLSLNESLSLVNFLKKENLELITNKGLIIDSYNILQINENYLMKLQEFLQSSFDHDLSLLETMESSEFKEFNQYKFYKEFHRINVSKEYLKKEEIYFEKN